MGEGGADGPSPLLNVVHGELSTESYDAVEWGADVGGWPFVGPRQFKETAPHLPIGTVKGLLYG